MMGAESKETIDDEIFGRLPKAYRILVEFARERGLIESREMGQATSKQHEGGKPNADA